MPLTRPASVRSRRVRRWLAAALVGALGLAMSSCGACGSGQQAGVASGGRATPSATQATPAPDPPLPPDPGELLASDLAAGTLTPDQAARYRVFRIFKPSEVPERYRYASAPRSGTWDVLQAVRLFPRLSPAVARELTPYLVRPSDARSIFRGRQPGDTPPSGAARMGFEAVLHADAPLAKKVHVTDKGYTIEVIGDAILAERVEKARDLIAAHKMYEKYFELLQRETRDYGERTLVIRIFPWLAEVTRAGERFEPAGLCFPDVWVPEGGHPGNTAPAWIAISSRQASSDFLLAVTLAHEMFHAFQFAFSTAEEKWLVEGSAVWAEDFIGHDWNDEQGYLTDTFKAERFRHNRLNEPAAGTAYGMYLFFYYLSRVRSGGDASVMRTIWQQCEAARGATLASVTAAVGGDFATVFHEYARLTLDEGDVQGKFADEVRSGAGLDPQPPAGSFDPLPLSSMHMFRGLWHIDEAGRFLRKGVLAVEPMGVGYGQITNGVVGPAAPTAVVDLSEFKGDREAAITAVIQYRDGRSDTEDWSDLGRRIFCLALDSQNFEYIFLAVSLARDSGRARPFVLNVEPDPEIECAAAQLTLTMTETGEEGVQYARRVAATKKDKITIRRWRQRVSFGLDLVPQRRNTAADAGRVLGGLPGPAKDAARGPLLQPMEGEDDESTGCTVYTFRVSAVRPTGFERASSLSSTETDNDAHGLAYYRKLTDEERWVSQGLAPETRQWLSDESLRVRVYVDPASRRIKWVSPQGPFSVAATGTRTVKQEGRQRLPPWPYDTYEDIGRSGSHDLSATLSARHVSKDDNTLPLNPDWRATQGSATSARGEGRLARPLDRERRTDEGEVTTTRGMVTQTVEWSLRLAQPPGQRR